MIKYLYISDSAPYLNGGKGCNVLGYYWIKSVLAQVVGIETMRPFPQTQLPRLGRPVAIYWSLAGLGRGMIAMGLRKGVERIFLEIYLLLNRRRLINLGAERIFGFSGADWEFLEVIELYARRLKLPYDLYLVDDFQATLDLRSTTSKVKKQAAAVENRVLLKASRIWCISDGLADHIRRERGMQTMWLPMPVSEWEVSARPYKPTVSRKIFYIGSVNELYASSLRALIVVLRRRVDRGESWRLVIVSGATADSLTVLLGCDWCEVAELVRASSRDELSSTCREALAYVLPYSHDQEVSLLVKTSFPSKLTDYLTSGRPVLFHGPKDSSAIRYAQANGFPLVSITTEELDLSLDAIEHHDHEGTIKIYAEALAKYHSPAALQVRLVSNGGKQ